jgi:hypothetical protein
MTNLAQLYLINTNIFNELILSTNVQYQVLHVVQLVPNFLSSMLNSYLHICTRWRKNIGDLYLDVFDVMYYLPSKS